MKRYVWICMLAILVLFCGCSKMEADSDEPPVITLNHVYNTTVLTADEAIPAFHPSAARADTAKEMVWEEIYASGEEIYCLSRLKTLEFAYFRFDWDGNCLGYIRLPDCEEANNGHLSTKIRRILADGSFLYAFRTAEMEKARDSSGTLRRVDMEGNILAETELAGYDPYTLQAAAAEEYIAVCTGQVLKIYDYTLTLLGEYPLNTGYDSLQWGTDGFLYARNYNGVIERFDPDTGKGTAAGSKTEETELQYRGTDSLYRTGAEGLYRVSESGDMLLLDWTSNFIDGSTAEILTVRDDERILARISDPLTGSSNTVILSRVPEDALPTRQVITLAWFPYAADREELALLVNAFNRDQEQYFVQIREYDESMHLTEMEKLEQKMYGEMAVGNTPDLLAANDAAETFWLDLVKENRLTDLTELQGSLTGSVRASLTTGGSLYRVPMSVQYTTLLTAGEEQMTVESLLAAMDSMGTDEVLFSVNQIRNLLKVIQHNFVDSAEGTCNFEDDAFRQYLTLLDRMQAVTDEDLGGFHFNGSYSAARPDLPEHVASGKLRYAEMPVCTIEGIGAVRLFFENADVHMCGFPASPAILQVTTGFSVLEDGQCTAGAVEFLRYLLSDRVQVSGLVTDMALPVTSSAVDILLQDTWYQFMLREGKDLLDPAGETVNVVFFAKFWQEEDIVPFGSLGKEVVYTDEDKAAFRALTEDENVIRMADPTIDAILQEEISAYLSGDRTMEDTVRVLQSRVSTYLAE